MQHFRGSTLIDLHWFMQTHSCEKSFCSKVPFSVLSCFLTPAESSLKVRRRYSSFSSQICNLVTIYHVSFPLSSSFCIFSMFKCPLQSVCFSNPRQHASVNTAAIRHPTASALPVTVETQIASFLPLPTHSPMPARLPCSIRLPP